MTSKMKFSIESEAGARSAFVGEVAEERLTGDIESTLAQLGSGEWLVMHVGNEIPWRLLLGLKDIQFADSESDSSLESLSRIFGIAGSVGPEMPDFEFSRLVLHFDSNPNLPQIAILSRLEDTLFLACEVDLIRTNGIVALRELASFSYCLDSFGAPISWSGGGVLIQVNPFDALSIGTGDSEPEPEWYSFRHQSPLSDDEARSMAYWLSENRLALPFAWSQAEPSPQSFTQEEIQAFEQIIAGLELRLEINLEPEGLLLIHEYLPKQAPLYLKLRNSIARKEDPMMWEIFLHHGLCGMLSDGGVGLEESYELYSQAKVAIQKYYLLPEPFRGPMPELEQTKRLVEKLERLQPIQDSEIERILRNNEDPLLRVSLKQLRKDLGEESPASECLKVLIEALEIWLEWQELRADLPMLIDEAMS
jgi:hypothetical protein